MFFEKFIRLWGIQKFYLYQYNVLNYNQCRKPLNLQKNKRRQRERVITSSFCLRNRFLYNCRNTKKLPQSDKKEEARAKLPNFVEKKLRHKILSINQIFQNIFVN